MLGQPTCQGAHGVGSVGAAIAIAFFNAIGTRIRSLPLTLDKGLAGWSFRVVFYN